MSAFPIYGIFFYESLRVEKISWSLKYALFNLIFSDDSAQVVYPNDHFLFILAILPQILTFK